MASMPLKRTVKAENMIADSGKTSGLIKDQIIAKLQEQNILLKERFKRADAQSQALEQELLREKKRSGKKHKTNRQLKELGRTLQMRQDSFNFYQ